MIKTDKTNFLPLLLLAAAEIGMAAYAYNAVNELPFPSESPYVKPPEDDEKK